MCKPAEALTARSGSRRGYPSSCPRFFMLSFSFMPRLKDLKDQQLWRMDRKTSYGAMDPLFSGTVETALIAEQWDQLVRIASSLRNRTAPAHVVSDHWAASSPSDRLAKAMTMLGRIVKTPYAGRSGPVTTGRS